MCTCLFVIETAARSKPAIKHLFFLTSTDIYHCLFACALVLCLLTSLHWKRSIFANKPFYYFLSIRNQRWLPQTSRMVINSKHTSAGYSDCCCFLQVSWHQALSAQKEKQMGKESVACIFLNCVSILYPFLCFLWVVSIL